MKIYFQDILLPRKSISSYLYKICFVLLTMMALSGQSFAVAPGGVLITEVMYNPSACTDATGEWVELFNPGPVAVNIGGLRLKDNTTTTATLSAVTLNPGDYYIVAKGACGIVRDDGFTFALNNTGDSVNLLEGSVVIDSVTYGNNASPAGVTWVRKADASGNPVDTDSNTDWQQGVAGGTPRAGYISVAAQCSVNNECGIGELCCTGACVAAVCNSDLDCGGAQVCQNPGACNAACISPPPAPGAVKVMSYNVNFGGQNPAWKDVVKQENPDIAVFVEVGNWDDANNALLNQYVAELNAYFSGVSPYYGSVAQNTGVPNTGTAIMSRFPIVSTTQLSTLILDNGQTFNPTHDLMVWGLDVGGGQIAYVVGMYFKCCGGASNDDIRNKSMEGLINYLDTLGDVPLIMLGDYNSVSPSDTNPANPDYNATFEPAPASDLGWGPITMLLYPADATFGRFASNGVHTFTDVFRALHPICAVGDCCGNGQNCSDTGACKERGYTFIDGTFDSRIDFIIVNTHINILGPSTVGDTGSACLGSDHLNLDAYIDFNPGAPGNSIPTASISSPTNGTIVGNTSLIQINATDVEDAAGTLIVEVRIDNGPWIAATYNAVSSRYEYNWDTTSVSDGGHSVNARATDSVNQTQNTAPIAVTVNNGGAATTANVSDLDISAAWANSDFWDATVVITVIDNLGMPAANATVTGTWTGNGTDAMNCTTNSSGQCNLTERGGEHTSALTLTIGTISHVALSYNAAANSDPDGDSNGTAITQAIPGGRP